MIIISHIPAECQLNTSGKMNVTQVVDKNLLLETNKHRYYVDKGSELWVRTHNPGMGKGHNPAQQVAHHRTKSQPHLIYDKISDKL